MLVRKRDELLNDVLKMAKHNYSCYHNWEGKFDEEEQKAKEEIELLEIMLKELPETDGLREFIGFFSHIQREKNFEGEEICSYVVFDIDPGFYCGARDPRIFFVDDEMGKEWFICTKERLSLYIPLPGQRLKIWVDLSNQIKKIEWINKVD